MSPLRERTLSLPKATAAAVQSPWGLREPGVEVWSRAWTSFPLCPSAPGSQLECPAHYLESVCRAAPPDPSAGGAGALGSLLGKGAELEARCQRHEIASAQPALLMFATWE